jgi:hypothetical protein
MKGVCRLTMLAVCVSVGACVGACVRGCVRAGVRACLVMRSSNHVGAKFEEKFRIQKNKCLATMLQAMHWVRCANR